MSQDDLFGAPAGWYPDPLGLPQLRWWNNHAWTEQTSAARQPVVMQDTKFAWADDELPTRREERERERTRDDGERADIARPTAETLRQLEPPRAFSKIDNQAAAATAAAAQPVTQPPAAAQPTTAQPAAAQFVAAQPAAQPAAAQPVAAQPGATQPLETDPTAAPRVDSLYVPDPVVEAPVTAMPSFDPGLSATPAATAVPPEESLDALFGQRGTREPVTKLKTPIVTADAVSATATKLGQVSNGPAWIIAMIPLFQLVLSLLLMNFGLGGIPSIFIGILVVPYFIVLMLAFIDHRSLKAAGYSKPANWKWALLSAPVYLLLRARSVIAASGRGIGPVLVWFGLAFLHIASVLAIPGLVISVVPNLFTPQIEQSVARDAQLISGTNLRVTCPEAPPVLIGQQTICHSVGSNGNKSDITVALSRSNGWIAWQVVDWGEFTMQR